MVLAEAEMVTEVGGESAVPAPATPAQSEAPPLLILGAGLYQELVEHREQAQATADDAPPPRTLEIIAAVLESTVRYSEQHLGARVDLYAPQGPVTVFHGSRPPAIAIGGYVERIWKYGKPSLSCFIAAFVYLERFCQRTYPGAISELSVHRLLIAAVVIAAKFLDDAYFNNAYYAKVGGVSTEEINRLEIELLLQLDFKLFVSTEELQQTCARLEAATIARLGGHPPALSAKGPPPAPAGEETPVYGPDSMGHHKGVPGGGAAVMMAVA